MGKKRTDTAREQRLKAIDASMAKLLADNPELQARTRAYLAGELPPARGADLMLTLRVSPELVARADRLVLAVATDPDVALTMGRVTRSTVLRLSIVEGLRVLGRKYGRAN